jgi:prepilin-type N-terminal cleavage/methylation domain-containing protein/prepilin-type processing-associated H-X9-DG protein
LPVFWNRANSSKHGLPTSITPLNSLDLQENAFYGILFLAHAIQCPRENLPRRLPFLLEGFIMNPNMQAGSFRTPQRAFTLVEMLVVIAIIGILMSLLLPALQRAREASRKIKCASNLRMVALALTGYQEAHNTYPPSINFPSITANDGTNYFAQKLKYQRNGEMFTKTDFGYNWVIAILPYIELKPLYMSFVFRSINTTTHKFETRQLTINDSFANADGNNVIQNNYAALATKIPVMLCPSDNPNADLYQIPGGDPNLNWGRGNYAANGANGLFTTDAAWLPNTQGVMDANRALTSAQIRDGLTQTMLLGEIRIGVHKNDPRGTWGLGTPGASSLWAHGAKDSYGMAAAPNPMIANSETIMYGNTVISSVTAAYLEGQGMSVANTNSNQKSVVRSRHPGGANMAMCDGSVIFVVDSIDSNPNFPTTSRPATYQSQMGLWQRMIGSNDGLHADLTDYHN